MVSMRVSVSNPGVCTMCALADVCAAFRQDSLKDEALKRKQWYIYVIPAFQRGAIKPWRWDVQVCRRSWHSPHPNHFVFATWPK
jgi:hypothetical protein